MHTDYEFVPLKSLWWIVSRLCTTMLGVFFLIDAAFNYWHKFWILQLGVIVLMGLFFGLVRWAERSCP